MSITSYLAMQEEFSGFRFSMYKTYQQLQMDTVFVQRPSAFFFFSFGCSCSKDILCHIWFFIDFFINEVSIIY